MSYKVDISGTKANEKSNLGDELHVRKISDSDHEHI